MAESLLLPVVQGVASKATGALIQNVTRMCGVEGDRCKLERQLLAVQCKLTDAEVKSETNQYVKRWMKDFRTVAYEADDVLGDFMYEALRCQAQIGVSRTRKVLIHFTSHSPLLFRLTMSRKLRNVLEKINELVEEMNTFGLLNSVEQPQVPCRQTHAALNEYAEIFGRDDDRELVVKLLLDQQDNPKVQVLPIFGMGGLGKTTLAKMVYNDHRVQQHFQLNMWHCVSENFEASSLVKSIIELATKGACNLPETIELLRTRLQEVIGQKRYLLVLDDAWNEEERKWEDELKPLLCSVGGPGSVVVVTCRSQRVASIMGTLGPHKLAYLNEDDSWELFSKKAFSNCVEEQTELVTIGRYIVKKCGGLPLALKMMGGLMSSKQQVHEWKAIEENNIGGNVSGKYEVLPILKLSYRHLTSEMKQCFAFCAVFPKDCDMEKDLLIQLWMANGILQEEVTMDLQQKGEFIFRNLVWRSFLQDVKVKKFYSHDTVTTYESTVCRMHDLMHDLAKDVTDECIVIEEFIKQKASLKDVRHMQISNDDRQVPREQINGLLKGSKSLRTLLMSPASSRDLKDFKMMSLRALRCYSYSTINSLAVNAKHVRYLDLCLPHIVRLPESVSMLYNLQTLRLNSCSNLQWLPEGISAMKKLSHLSLLGCHKLEQMPLNISLLNNLRTLTTFVVDTGAGRGIEELKDLCHLANRLELYNLRKIKSGSNAKEANLYQKQSVDELFMYWGHGRGYMPEDEVANEQVVLESLAPHSKLQILEVHGYGGVEISQWMRNPQMFQCLRKLTISNCPRCKDLPIVWLSVSLEYLHVSNMGSLTTLCKSIELEAKGYASRLHFFPILKEMTLYALPSLERLTENFTGHPNSLVSFPVLQELRMQSCPKLASVPSSPVLRNLVIRECCSLPISLLAHLTMLSEFEYDGTGYLSPCIPLGSWPSLMKLTVLSLANMMMLPAEDQQSQSQRSLETLPKSLNEATSHVPKPGLFRSHPGLWECFAFVDKLLIQRCNELVHWPVKELQILARLRTLVIYDCDKLEGQASSSVETLPLPQLESLQIVKCDSLLEIPKLPWSLEVLNISSCISLLALPSNLGDLAKLRRLSVESCDGLKDLPDGMDGLISLEVLNWGCSRVEEFPHGLLQRLPALKSLSVSRCPELQRRCREGGEYFCLVSSIPSINIQEPWRPYQEETGSNMKKLVRKLLPSCAGSNTC